MIEKECPICNSVFYAQRTRRKYCSDRCLERARQIERQAKAASSAKAKQATKEKMTLSEVVAAARAAGMSYGEYVARYGG